MKFLKSFFYTFLFVLIIEIAGYWILLEYYYDFSNFIYLVPLLNSIISAILILAWIWFLTNSKFFSISKTSSKYYFLAAILGFSFAFLQSPLNFFYNEIFNSNYTIVYNFDLNNILSWNIISSVILAPFYEEFFFRKYLQQRLCCHYKPFLGILLASLLFSLIHTPYELLIFENLDLDFHQAYITFFGGLLSGILFYNSKSIGPSIVMHSFWNLSTYIL